MIVRLTLLVVGVTAGMVGLALYQSRPRPGAISAVIEADDIRVGSLTGGRVQTVLVQEGQEVAPGQTLARLDPYNLPERLAEAEAERAAAKAVCARLATGFREEEREQARGRRDAAQAAYEEAVAGPRKEEVEQATELHREALADLRLARQLSERSTALYKQQAGSKEEMDRDTARTAAAEALVNARRAQLELLRNGTRSEVIAQCRARLEQARAEVRLVENGYRSEELEEANARLRMAEARVQALQKQMRELDIVAPVGAVVEAVSLRPGDMVAPSAPAVTLVERGRLWARTYLPESHLARAQLNAPVRLLVDGFPGRSFTGKVVFTAHLPEFTPNNVQTPDTRGNQVYRVRIAITEGLDVLRPGMAASLSFDAGGP
jgi:multidrug resistance efflux pump